MTAKSRKKEKKKETGAKPKKKETGAKPKKKKTGAKPKKKETGAKPKKEEKEASYNRRTTGMYSHFVCYNLHHLMTLNFGGV